LPQPSCQPRHPATRRTETRLISGIIPSGVAFVDDWLAGVREGGAHLLTGGPGAGKSTLALHFADCALERGQRVAMLVTARAAHLRAHAAYLGIDLDAPLRDGRLLLLRYRPDLVHRMTHAASPMEVIAELATLLEQHAPSRVVVDGVGPLIPRAASPAAAAAAFAAALGQSPATSLLTFSEDLTDGYDRGIEPIVQACSFIVHLTAEGGGVRRADLVNLRYPAPLANSARFVIRPGIGIVGDHAVRGDRVSLRIP
jgi:KaiC/GvpD/RAD55 family RecA-like ATPase